MIILNVACKSTQIYGWKESTPEKQGAIVTFNLRRSVGRTVGKKEICSHKTHKTHAFADLMDRQSATPRWDRRQSFTRSNSERVAFATQAGVRKQSGLIPMRLFSSCGADTCASMM